MAMVDSDMADEDGTFVRKTDAFWITEPDWDEHINPEFLLGKYSFDPEDYARTKGSSLRRTSKSTRFSGEFMVNGSGVEKSENTLMDSLTQQNSNSFDERSVDLDTRKKSESPFSRRRSKQPEELSLNIFKSADPQNQERSIPINDPEIKRFFTPNPFTSAGQLQHQIPTIITSNIEDGKSVTLWTEPKFDLRVSSPPKNPTNLFN